MVAQKNLGALFLPEEWGAKHSPSPLKNSATGPSVAFANAMNSRRANEKNVCTVVSVDAACAGHKTIVEKLNVQVCSATIPRLELVAGTQNQNGKGEWLKNSNNEALAANVNNETSVESKSESLPSRLETKKTFLVSAAKKNKLEQR